MASRCNIMHNKLIDHQTTGPEPAPELRLNIQRSTTDAASAVAGQDRTVKCPSVAPFSNVSEIILLRNNGSKELDALKTLINSWGMCTFIDFKSITLASPMIDINANLWNWNSWQSIPQYTDIMCPLSVNPLNIWFIFGIVDIHKLDWICGGPNHVAISF